MAWSLPHIGTALHMITNTDLAIMASAFASYTHAAHGTAAPAKLGGRIRLQQHHHMHQLMSNLLWAIAYDLWATAGMGIHWYAFQEL